MTATEFTADEKRYLAQRKATFKKYAAGGDFTLLFVLWQINRQGVDDEAAWARQHPQSKPDSRVMREEMRLLEALIPVSVATKHGTTVDGGLKLVRVGGTNE